MSGEDARVPTEKELAFFGAVTASLSHEINNVVAIVSELTGLLDDLLFASEQGRPLDRDKLKQISEKMDKQVKKGQTIIKRLNRFAHSVDDPVKQVELKPLLLLISSISERFAFLKNVTLETDFPDDALTIETNPFALQQAFFLCVQIMLASAKKDDVVRVASSDKTGQIEIAFSGISVGADSRKGENARLLSTLAQRLGGRVEIAPSNADFSIALFIPHTLPDNAAAREKKVLE